MPLKPNMDTYQWNEYYLILAAAILPSIVLEFGEWMPDVVDGIFRTLTVGVVTTLAFIREPRKGKENGDK